MKELFTTPRRKEADVVRSILKEHHYKYKSREEDREHGFRFCIYVLSGSVDKAAKVVDEGLLERDM